MKNIEQTYTIHASVDRVWAALTDPSVIDQWGGGPAVMSAEENVAFSLWGGDIYGTNTKMAPLQLIEQDWYSGTEWQTPSHVAFRVTDLHDATSVHLVHTDVPAADQADIADGWITHYMGPIKALLERKV